MTVGGDNIDPGMIVGVDMLVTKLGDARLFEFICGMPPIDIGPGPTAIVGVKRPLACGARLATWIDVGTPIVSALPG